MSYNNGFQAFVDPNEDGSEYSEEAEEEPMQNAPHSTTHTTAAGGGSGNYEGGELENDEENHNHVLEQLLEESKKRSLKTQEDFNARIDKMIADSDKAAKTKAQKQEEADFARACLESQGLAGTSYRAMDSEVGRMLKESREFAEEQYNRSVKKAISESQWAAMSKYDADLMEAKEASHAALVSATSGTNLSGSDDRAKSSITAPELHFAASTISQNTNKPKSPSSGPRSRKPAQKERTQATASPTAQVAAQQRQSFSMDKNLKVAQSLSGKNREENTSDARDLPQDGLSSTSAIIGGSELRECISCNEQFGDSEVVQIVCKHYYCGPCIQIKFDTWYQKFKNPLSQPTSLPRCCMQPIQPSLLRPLIDPALVGDYKTKAMEMQMESIKGD